MPGGAPHRLVALAAVALDFFQPLDVQSIIAALRDKDKAGGHQAEVGYKTQARFGIDRSGAPGHPQQCNSRPRYEE